MLKLLLIFLALFTISNAYNQQFQTDYIEIPSSSSQHTSQLVGPFGLSRNQILQAQQFLKGENILTDYGLQVYSQVFNLTSEVAVTLLKALGRETSGRQFADLPAVFEYYLRLLDVPASVRNSFRFNDAVYGTEEDDSQNFKHYH